jgi:hypothetical protein
VHGRFRTQRRTAPCPSRRGEPRLWLLSRARRQRRRCQFRLLGHSLWFRSANPRCLVVQTQTFSAGRQVWSAAGSPYCNGNTASRFD